jgi:hypothetical protein
VSGDACLESGIIVTGFQASQSGDQSFQPGKKVNRGKTSIAPSSGDAIVLGKGSDVMSQMIPAAEDDPDSLQEPDERWRPPHVCPLVNLVRKDTDEAECKPEDRGTTPPFAIQREDEYGQQEGNDDHRDVAINIEKLPAREVIRIDVMYAERPKQPATNQRERLPAPGVGRPMNEARNEIGPSRASNECDRQPPSVHGHSEHAGKLDREQQSSRGNGQNFGRPPPETEVIVSRELREPGPGSLPPRFTNVSASGRHNGSTSPPHRLSLQRPSFRGKRALVI